ncbi:MAG: flagellar hook-basal body protein [Planctomycetes bacterium]|nr:flagellar hook-basal body protein [Planctomycetota bacterium]
MIYGMYQSAAGMMVNEYRQDLIANNLANADTAGFKREIATFAERLPASVAGERRGPSNDMLQGLTGGLWLGRTHTDFSEGSFAATGNPLDVALEGPGFLMVQVDGEQLLTRDGRMLMDADGRLLAAVDGAEILSEAGAPIRLDPRGGSPYVDSEGRIFQDDAEVARLGLRDFIDYRVLQKVGTGRFRAAGGRQIAPAARAHGGFIESSGVEPVKELVSMIEAARAYQLNAEMVSLQSQSLGQLINQVARV